MKPPLGTLPAEVIKRATDSTERNVSMRAIACSPFPKKPAAMLFLSGIS
ncbi:Unknown protein sequence [Pseudomonas syringae pv. cilantro]|uniref:Uncharacterized protein n=1 Tax=Pseudomonas syringae pv. cilantro TaxID=81035 RepID=A0A0N0XBG8_PSESX|nr:Unknown protein sequence [Pseudomonas syringae pv. cilantro]